MVTNGKPRLGSRIPAVSHHYQHLPPAWIKPNTPNMLDSIHTDMKPIDYIGLYIIVIIASCVTVNWLYRIYL